MAIQIERIRSRQPDRQRRVGHVGAERFHDIIDERVLAFPGFVEEPKGGVKSSFNNCSADPGLQQTEAIVQLRVRSVRRVRRLSDDTPLRPENGGAGTFDSPQGGYC